MRSNISALALSAALAAASPAWAGQVPSPINAPATAAQGDALTAGSNPQQAADSGISLSSQPANVVLAGPTSGGSAAPTFRGIAPADLPVAGTTTFGAVKAKAPTAHQWINGLTAATGVFTETQPDCSDLTTAAAHCGTNASEVTSGTVPAANGGAGTVNGALKANGSGAVSQAAACDLSDCVARTTFAPTVGFATAGNQSIAYTTQTGAYYKVGSLVCFWESLAFTATYMTAAGNFQISEPPVGPTDGTVWAFPLKQLSAPTWPGSTDTQVSAVAQGGVFLLSGLKSGAGAANFTTTQIVSGTAYSVILSGCYF